MNNLQTEHLNIWTIWILISFTHDSCCYYSLFLSLLDHLPELNLWIVSPTVCSHWCLSSFSFYFLVLCLNVASEESPLCLCSQWLDRVYPHILKARKAFVLCLCVWSMGDTEKCIQSSGFSSLPKLWLSVGPYHVSSVHVHASVCNMLVPTTNRPQSGKVTGLYHSPTAKWTLLPTMPLSMDIIHHPNWVNSLQPQHQSSWSSWSTHTGKTSMTNQLGKGE